ncbi:hypothetical protein V6W11_26695 [Micromonospora profundi]|uniref:hypothetical protein n=1 Tax=Micromonospora profundi TaxID=1420889 RepID=UPI002FEED442
MSRFVLLAVSVVAALLASAGPAPSTERPPDGQPRVALPAGTFRVGDRVLVALDGWPAGVVQVEVCGNDGRRGALDCATDRASGGQVPATGNARMPVLLAAPPVACPCRLRVQTPSGVTTASVALPLTGVSAPVASTAGSPPELALAGVHAVDESGVGGWFGLPGELTVRITLHNPGPVDVVEPPVTLLAGSPGQVHTMVAAPPVGTIPGGQSSEYVVRVPLSATTLGRYEVRGLIEPASGPLPFVVATARHPWGLLVVPAALLVLLSFSLPGRPRASATSSATPTGTSVAGTPDRRRASAGRGRHRGVRR